MKHLIFTITLFLFVYSYSQEIVFNEGILITESEEIIADALKRIGSSEEANCTYNLGRFRLEHYFDDENGLVKTIRRDTIASASILSAPVTEIFDVHGNLILRKKQDNLSNELYYLTIFKYDSVTKLIEEFHLSSTHIYRLVYKHRLGYRKTKKTYYNSAGKKVSSWKRAKRKNQKT